VEVKEEKEGETGSDEQPFDAGQAVGIHAE
jgi:hypothetical protein